MGVNVAIKFRPTIAGHEFTYNTIDCNCIRLNGGEPCWMTRSALFLVTEEDIGKTGFAHVPTLNRSEYTDIVEERKAYEAHCDTIMEATRLTSTG